MGEVMGRYHRNQHNSPGVNTLPASAFLKNDTFVEGKILKKIVPRLDFLDMSTRYNCDHDDIIVVRDLQGEICHQCVDCLDFPEIEDIQKLAYVIQEKKGELVIRTYFDEESQMKFKRKRDFEAKLVNIRKKRRQKRKKRKLDTDDIVWFTG